MPRRCPPGVFCISDHLVTILLVGFLMIFAYYVVMTVHFPASLSPLSSSLPSIPSLSTVTASLAPSLPTFQQTIVQGDSRYQRAPQPLRDWMAPPELSMGGPSLPINIPTRGLPESFQSVGMITVEDKVLPLYGRRTAGGSDRWNYYTRTDTYNPVPLPIRYQRRDCMDDTGCGEIFSGEQVKVDGIQKDGKVEIYKMGGPKYIPGLL